MSRPTKEAEAGTQVTISLRVPAELKTRMEQRAAANHRNLSQECERALQRSFDASALLDDGIDVLLARGGTISAEGFEFIWRAIAHLCGSEAARAAAEFAVMLGAVELLNRSSGGKVTIRKEALDQVKTALMRLERECNVVTNRTGKVEPSPESTSDSNATSDALVQQVRDALVLRIASGQWKPNAPIPKASELAREFGVNPETMRKALDLMEGQRLLTRRTYAAAPPRGPQVYLFTASRSGDRAAEAAA